MTKDVAFEKWSTITMIEIQEVTEIMSFYLTFSACWEVMIFEIIQSFACSLSNTL